MPVDASELTALLEFEISRIGQPELTARIRECLVPVRCEQREWNYGSPEARYPCWIVAEHEASNSAIVYCADGFGPSCPWGLLCIRGEDTSMGMDCSWFLSLEDAFRTSAAWDGEDPPGYEVG